jgi:adenylosuccinate synthase
VLGRVEPIYRVLPGWETALRDARTPTDLPQAARDLINVIERETEVPVGVVGVGAERDDHVIFHP